MQIRFWWTAARKKFFPSQQECRWTIFCLSFQPLENALWTLQNTLKSRAKSKFSKTIRSSKICFCIVFVLSDTKIDAKRTQKAAADNPTNFISFRAIWLFDWLQFTFFHLRWTWFTLYKVHDSTNATKKLFLFLLAKKNFAIESEHEGHSLGSTELNDV